MLLNIALFVLGLLTGGVLVFIFHGSILADITRALNGLGNYIATIKTKLGA